MAEMTRRKCAFCPDNEPCAIMYTDEERSLAVHQNCVLFASGFMELEEENSEDLDKRFDVASVMKEIKRGRALTCTVCRKKGATIGCEVKSCRKSYHYFCALRGQASTETDEDQGLYRVFCPDHIQAKRSRSYDENNEKAVPLAPTESSSTSTKMVTSVMAEMTRRKCAFCPDNEPCAIMYIDEERNLAVHQNCLLFASGFMELEEENPEDLDKRFDVASVMKEIKRGRRLLCTVCDQSGATIGCKVKNCPQNYHYLCALRGDASVETDEDEGLYRVFCPDHIQAKRSRSYGENSEKEMPLAPAESSSTSTKMLCSICKERGAIIGCKVKNSPKNYHNFCASRGDASTETDEDQGPYRLFCPGHIQAKRYRFSDENNEKAVPLAPAESSSTTTQMNGETVEEENMEVTSEKCDQAKERIEFLKKCKQAGLLNEIFEEMLNTLRLAQEKLMDDNTSEAEYEETVVSLFDCGLFETILRAAHSGTEGKIQELMNTRKGLDAQIELLRVLKETAFPASEDNTSSSIS